MIRCASTGGTTRTRTSRTWVIVPTRRWYATPTIRAHAPTRSQTHAQSHAHALQLRAAHTRSLAQPIYARGGARAHAAHTRSTHAQQARDLLPTGVLDWSRDWSRGRSLLWRTTCTTPTRRRRWRSSRRRWVLPLAMGRRRVA
eukprot:676148-Prymnesium_polylepis.1